LEKSCSYGGKDIHGIGETMNVIHVYDEYGPVLGGGSAPTVVLNLSKVMVKWGHDVTVIERRHENEPLGEEVDGVKFVRVKAKKRVPYPSKGLESPVGVLRLLIDGIEFSLKVRKYLVNNDFDVVHVHFPFATSILATIDKKLRNKMIYTAHIGEEGKRLKLSSDVPLLLRLFSPDLYLMKQVKKTVVLNESLKAKLIEKGIDEEKLVVVPNGINVNDFGNFGKDVVNRIKEKYGIVGKITIMFAGSITPRKGVDYLVRAAEIILRNGYEDILFLLVGSFKYNEKFANKIVRYVRSRGLEENVKFTGFVPYEDLKVLYQACDVFVLPSFEEGHGIVLTEAMASGKPLIGSNVGGIPAQIRDGWNGFLIEPGNEKQLAEKIKYLIDNPEERERMAENSKKLAKEEFDWKKIAEKYLKVYEEVAE